MEQNQQAIDGETKRGKQGVISQQLMRAIVHPGQYKNTDCRPDTSKAKRSLRTWPTVRVALVPRTGGSRAGRQIHSLPPLIAAN
jgi:hypothetical protein